MANVYHSQGNYARALEFGEKALAIQTAALEEQHPDIAATYTIIAKVFKQQNNTPGVREFARKAVGIFVAKLGPDHPRLEQARRLLEETSQSSEDNA
jgi:hypothetical protein